MWIDGSRAKVKQLQRKEAGDETVFYGMSGTPGVMDQMKRNVLMRSNSVGGHGGHYGALPPDIKFGLRMGSWNGPLTPAASPSSKTGLSFFFLNLMYSHQSFVNRNTIHWILAPRCLFIYGSRLLLFRHGRTFHILHQQLFRRLQNRIPSSPNQGNQNGTYGP